MDGSGFANQVYRWNGSQWVYWLTTQPLFHFKPSNIFEQAFETRDWYDAKPQPSSGLWNYHRPKNMYYAVVTGMGRVLDGEDPPIQMTSG